MLPQPRHARQIGRLPTLGEMLNGTFLIGQEEDDVHPRQIPGRLRRPRYGGFHRGNGKRRGRQKIATFHHYPFRLPVGSPTFLWKTQH